MKTRDLITGFALFSAVALCPMKCNNNNNQPIQDNNNVQWPPAKLVNQPEEDIFTMNRDKKILVVDEFVKNHLSVDADKIPDISHGEVVSTIIQKGLPDYHIEKKNASISDMKLDNLNMLSDVIEKIKLGKKYDAVNLSMSSPVKYKALSELTGLDIKPENISDMRKEIKADLRNKTDMGLEGLKPIMSLIDNLDSISASGTKIYVAAGNSGNESFNLFSLVDNAVNVGAVDDYGLKEDWSADNSLTNRWADNTLNIKRTEDGFNFTNGDGTDISLNDVSTFFYLPEKMFGGTSFAAPKAIVEDLK